VQNEDNKTCRRCRQLDGWIEHGLTSAPT